VVAREVFQLNDLIERLQTERGEGDGSGG